MQNAGLLLLLLLLVRSWLPAFGDAVCLMVYQHTARSWWLCVNSTGWSRVVGHNGWTLQAAATTQLQTLQPAASAPPGRSAPRSNSVMPPRCSAGSGSGPTISSFSSRAASSACRAAASALADCAASHSLQGNPLCLPAGSGARVQYWRQRPPFGDARRQQGMVRAKQVHVCTLSSSDQGSMFHTQPVATDGGMRMRTVVCMCHRRQHQQRT
jgi:hypothetical protein